MKLVITQLNVGGRLRFIPGGANGTSLHNYPRDGWLTEAAAKRWAKQNGHEIVKVEKMAGKGEKTFRIEYTYRDRNGRTKTSSPEFVGTSVEPLKKRIIEGLERNGDKLISFGKITSKDSVDYVEEIRQKYAKDAVEINDFDATPSFGYQDILNRYMSIMDRKRKTPATSYEKSEIIRAYNLFKQKAGNGTFAKEWLPKYKRHFKRFGITLDSVDEIRNKYHEDKLLITSKGFSNENGTLKKDPRKGLKPFEVAFIVKGKDGKPFRTVRSKMAASLEEAKRWANQESRKYNGVTKIEVKEFKDEADSIEMIKAKYSEDAMVSKSELDKKKYTQFFVNGEDINGKVLRIPRTRFNKFEDAVRVAKSLQNANTRLVYVEGGWDNNQVEPKALYEWRNPKAK